MLTCYKWRLFSFKSGQFHRTPQSPITKINLKITHLKFHSNLPGAYPLQWRHNGRESVSNHQPHDCLQNGLFRRRSKKTWKLRVTGLCAGNSPGTVEFPAQMASSAENSSIWWRYHANMRYLRLIDSDNISPSMIYTTIWKRFTHIQMCVQRFNNYI